MSRVPGLYSSSAPVSRDRVELRLVNAQHDSHPFIALLALVSIYSALLTSLSQASHTRHVAINFQIVKLSVEGVD